MLKQTIAIEYNDGTITEPTRITLADKLAWEKTAKAHGWNVEDNAVTMNAFLAWSGQKRVGTYDHGFDQFLEEVTDISVDAEEINPTKRAPKPAK